MERDIESGSPDFICSHGVHWSSDCSQCASDAKKSPLAKQIGGSHYKDLAIQPVEYIYANGIGYFEGNVIKYVTRWKEKGGIDDLEKAKHYIDLLIGFHKRQGK